MSDDCCPCGAKPDLWLNGLPVCRECFEASIHADGVIRPGKGCLVVRSGGRWRRIPMETDGGEHIGRDE